MLNNIIKKTVDEWMSGNYDEKIKNEIREMLAAGNEKEIEDAFYKKLEFGTGGLRGIMGAGPNRMNIYTVGSATQGLANYIIKTGGEEAKKNGVAIAYDSRNNSKEFAERAAEILSSNAINVYIYDDIKPIALLSFAVRHIGCVAGIVVTASHNPKEYNGYKVFGKDGAQVIPPEDKNIIEEVNKVEIKDVKDGDKSLVKIIEKNVEKAYFEKARTLIVNESALEFAGDAAIVYTPLHGSGYKVVPEFLNMLGFKKLDSLSNIQSPNGDFPTVPTPNPEEPAALSMAIERAKETESELVIGTDPDCDRVGMAMRVSGGEYKTLTGNQIATIFLYYLLSSKKENQTLGKNMYVVKSIVTTDLINVIARDFGVSVYEVLTGFKWIAQKIEILGSKEPDKKFIFGCEESHGYLFGDFVRDKDGISSSAMLCEINAYCKQKNIKMYDYLEDIYKKYGYYHTEIVSIVEKGVDGVRKIASMMKRYRESPPAEIAGTPIASYKDYLEKKHCKIDGTILGIIDLPTSDVMQYMTTDASVISIRPSGTEPKIKFYFEVRVDGKDMSKAEKNAKDKIERLKSIIM